MTVEEKIREALIKRGINKQEADREAFLIVDGLIDGSIAPETGLSLGLTEKEVRICTTWNSKSLQEKIEATKQ